MGIVQQALSYLYNEPTGLIISGEDCGRIHWQTHHGPNIQCSSPNPNPSPYNRLQQNLLSYTPRCSQDHDRPHLYITDEKNIKEILANANVRRVKARHRRDTEDAISLYQEALLLTRRSHAPTADYQVHAYFGIIDCYSDLSESDSKHLDPRQKMGYVRASQDACLFVLWLVRQGDRPGQERRARVYKARAEAQEIIIQFETGKFNIVELGKSLREAQIMLRDVLSQMERDVHRDNCLWDLTEAKLHQLQQIEI